VKPVKGYALPSTRSACCTKNENTPSCSPGVNSNGSESRAQWSTSRRCYLPMNLDPELSREIMELFEQFNQVGVTVLIASHDIELITSLGHRRLILHDGQLINNGQSE